jgi:DnaJ-class molecular chaperone
MTTGLQNEIPNLEKALEVFAEKINAPLLRAELEKIQRELEMLKEITHRKLNVCPVCGGNKSIYNHEHGVAKTCSRCKGSGQYDLSAQS